MEPTALTIVTCVIIGIPAAIAVIAFFGAIIFFKLEDVLDEQRKYDTRKRLLGRERY